MNAELYFDIILGRNRNLITTIFQIGFAIEHKPCLYFLFLRYAIDLPKFLPTN